MSTIQIIIKKLEYIIARGLLRLPDGVLRALSGGKRTNQAGHLLDARIQMALLLDRVKPPLESLPPQPARRQLGDLTRIFDLSREDLPRVENLSVPGVARISNRIPMRLYAPTAQARDLPALVYFHGGGFVLGDLDGYDATMRYICKQSGCIVVSVDYRLAPDHPYPAPVDDALETYAWLHKNGALFGVDPKRVAVGGDSAGGNLALNICLQAASRRLKAPGFAALIYPWADVSETQNEDPSHREFGEGFALTAKLLEYFTRHTFLSTQKLEDPAVSPIFAATAQLKRMPPTLIQLCGFDPFRDQCLRLARRLEEAGVDCEAKLYPTLIHGAVSLAGVVPDALAMLDDYAAALAQFAAGAGDNGAGRSNSKRAKGAAAKSNSASQQAGGARSRTAAASP